MKNTSMTLSMLVLLVAGCESQSVAPSPTTKPQQVFTQQDLELMVGYEVTVEGKAVAGAAGPAVEGRKYLVYVDGISRWPGHLAGQDVKVRGTLQRRPNPAPAEAGRGPAEAAAAPGSSAAPSAAGQLVLKDPKW